MRTSCAQADWKSQRFEALAANSRANSSIRFSISSRVIGTGISFLDLLKIEGQFVKFSYDFLVVSLG